MVGSIGRKSLVCQVLGAPPYSGWGFFGCLKTGDWRRWLGGVLVVQVGSRTIQGNSGTPIPFDPFPVFGSDLEGIVLLNML